MSPFATEEWQLDIIKPADIARRQFSRTLLGGADPEEVNEFLVEVAGAVGRMGEELAQAVQDRNALQQLLKEATAEVENVQKQLTHAQEEIGAYQDQENLMARALMNAQKMTEDIIRTAKAQAEKITSDAKAGADEAAQSARKTGDEILRDAKARAEEMVRNTERAAAAKMAQLQNDAKVLVEQARQQSAEIKQAAEQYVAVLITKIEAFVSDRDGISRNFDALVKIHADSLELVKRLRGEVQNEMLPALYQLLEQVKKEEKKAAPEASAAPPAARSPRADGAAHPKGAPRPDDKRVVNLDVEAEIVVSPVTSYLQATKLVTAISRIKGIKTARLRSYSGGVITVDVSTESGTLAGFDVKHIGFPMDVVEATDNRLVLRIARAMPHSVRG